MLAKVKLDDKRVDVKMVLIGQPKPLFVHFCPFQITFLN